MNYVLLIPLMAAALAVGCSPNNRLAGPTPVAGGELTAEVRAAMEEAIGDEYRAETIYQGVIDDLGAVTPFTNIIGAEVRHSVAIARLYQTRGLTVPPNTWTSATVPHYASVPAACAAGVAAERDNIAIYDRHFALPLPADVRQVFQNNRGASINNHLPAFERCAP